jgi:hypothetical protein
MPEGKKDLYIGVNNELTPFCVDLNALTRGLVVVGQSGCGKSFLVGRLVEELIRSTTEKTRLLVIDSNSDFCEGLRLKEDDKFKEKLDIYNSGVLEKGAFESFQDRELQAFNKLKDPSIFPIGQIFGRGKKFNLSWKWLIYDHSRFLRIVKGNKFSASYLWSFVCLSRCMEPKYRYVPEAWIEGCTEILTLYARQTTVFQYIIHKEALLFVKWLKSDGFLELMPDLAKEVRSNIWREKDDDRGLPETLFAESNRINLIEVEKITEKEARLKTVAFILLHCLDVHKDLTEKYRESRNQEGKQKLNEADQNLKHTFILIDEAQNYAPDDTSDPHEKMLGELIHAIAAEGRKYGLHVILATQRPNKIKRGLLGECDNAIIMKMNSRSDLEHLAREMRILDVKLLEPCLHFQGQGNALAVGEMTRMAPYVQLFKSAPRRTREGGVDIPGF